MPKKEKIKLLISIAAIFIILFIMLFLFSIKSSSGKPFLPPAENLASTKPIEQKKVTKKPLSANEATLVIDGKFYKSNILADTPVYDFMNNLRAEGKINFKEKKYSGIGNLIEEINGTSSDGDRYWIYYVNGKKAEVGVSNYKINPGDVVSWKYEEYIN